MSNTSRKVVRDALKTLLTAKLVGVGLPVKTVVDSKQKVLEGKTPLVAILSGGTNRKRITFMGTKPTFMLSTQIWVLQEGTGWTLAQAEDALDDIEALISEVFADNAGAANWSIIEYSGNSIVEEVEADGKLYYVETIPTRVQTTKS